MKNLFLATFILIIALVMGGIMSCSDSNNTNPEDNSKPRINSINPNMGYRGFQIKINGVNFGETRGGSIIKFDERIIQVKYIKEWSDTQIILVVPDDMPEGDTMNVVVIVDGVESNAVEFIILEKNPDTPEITNLSKTKAVVGETVTIYGKNFGDPSSDSWVEFNEVKSTSTPVWTDNRIIALVPEEATTGKLVVWVNGTPSNGVDFEVLQKNQLLTMVNIPAGSFMMGDDNNSEMDNKPAHKVTITKDFLMSTTEISIKDWKLVMNNSNPSHPPDTLDNQPVQQVTFQRACLFCNRLSEMEGYTPAYKINGDNVTWDKNANGYRLPTEAEWEYACRAGRTQDYSYDEIVNMAWISDNAGGHTHEVGQRAKNNFGLYDMLGNVAAWCWDDYDADYYSKSPVNDPSGPENSEFNHRVTRGGSYVNGATKVNSSIRNSYPGSNGNYNYDLGFRVVRNK